MVDRDRRRDRTFWGTVVLVVLLLLTEDVLSRAHQLRSKDDTALAVLLAPLQHDDVARAYSILPQMPTARPRIITAPRAFPLENALPS